MFMAASENAQLKTVSVHLTTHIIHFELRKRLTSCSADALHDCFRIGHKAALVANCHARCNTKDRARQKIMLSFENS